MSDLNPTVYYVDPKHLCPHGFGKAVYCDACERTSVKVERDRYRAALEQIAVVGCDGDWGLVGRQTCTQRKSVEPCPSCIACAALEEK